MSWHRKLGFIVALVLAVGLVAGCIGVTSEVTLPTVAPSLGALSEAPPTPENTAMSEPADTSLPETASPAASSEDQPAANSYYVSLDGADDNDGSEAAPWRHIQHAVDQAGPGASIYVMDGVYNETVAFSTPGSESEGYITLQNYPGASPVIDGEGLAGSGEVGIIVLDDMAYVRIIGFEIRNLQAGGDPEAFPAGIWVRGRGDHIEIRDNNIHDIENSCEECGAHGIAVYGRDSEASIHDILIDGNEVHHNKLGWSESVVLNGNVEKFVVSDNVVHDNDNIGIDLIGFEGQNPDPNLDRARDGAVVGNLVYNINSYGNPAYGEDRSADGIYVDGGTGILIEANTVHHANIGIELASEHAGKDTSYITVRNNFVHDNTQVGIAIGGYDEERGRTEWCTIVNNTLFNNATEGDWGAELYIQFDTRFNVIKNNLIHANEARLFMESWSPVMTGNSVDYNLYYAPGGGTDGSWIWQGEAYDDFASYQAASGNDAHSVIGLDPLLVDPEAGDLHIGAGSPAVGAGQDLSEAGAADMDDEARIQGTIDIGADELE